MTLDFLKKYQYFVGVPDSYLKAVCDYLMETYGVSKEHIIAANEGTAVGLAAGYHLATGKVPVVYLQNSGIGNIINPVTSLLHEKVYGIPCLFLVGWRGEPDTKDEPQHKHQGLVTIPMLELAGIRSFHLRKDTSEGDFGKMLEEMEGLLAQGKQVALVVSKDALAYPSTISYQNNYPHSRESILEAILEVSGEDPIVATTGKTSRELYELREKKGQGHGFDFLTVGSMGHSSAIALSLALECPEKTVWCLDGDGAMLMHLGGLALIGQRKPPNLIHILLNNEAHESVGGAPTISKDMNWQQIAEGCGYPSTYKVENLEDLKKMLPKMKTSQTLNFVEVLCAIGSRDDLGRPKESPEENKGNFMKQLGQNLDRI